MAFAHIDTAMQDVIQDIAVIIALALYFMHFTLALLNPSVNDLWT